MADFVQTMKDWHRMCKAMTDSNPKDACDGCPLEAYGCSPVYEAIDSYQDIDFEAVGEEITAWAAEHPEPIYPMWCEWLADKCVVDVARMPVDYSGGIVTEIKPSGKMYEHIPADIAEKLGIEPKEGV